MPDPHRRYVRRRSTDAGAGLGVGLLELATNQHGVVSRAQLRGLGLTDAAIRHRVDRGYLVRVHHAVFALGPAGLAVEARWMASVLTCGDGALLSHVSASEHLDLLRSDSSTTQVTVPSHRDPRRRPDVRIHRARIHPSDRIVRDGIPLTSPCRTLLDLADVVPPSRVRQAWDQSLRLGLFDARDMDTLLDRSRGRRGLRLLQELRAEGRDDPPELRSAAERELLEHIRAAGLPLPQTKRRRRGHHG